MNELERMIDMSCNGPMSRRDFLRNAGRAVIITGFAGFGFFLLKKDRFVQAENQKCVSNLLCNECTEINTCTLPQALSARSELPVTNRYNTE
jgi:hypothetical protein